MKVHLQSPHKDPGFFPAWKACNYSLSIRPYNLEAIFDFTLFFLTCLSWCIWILFPFLLWSLFLSLSTSQICFSRLLLSLILLMTAFLSYDWPDLSKRSLETLFFHLSPWPISVAPFFVPTSLAYLHRFSCLCKPSSPLRAQSDIFFGSYAGLKQSLLPAIRSCLFNMPTHLLAQLFCSALW